MAVTEDHNIPTSHPENLKNISYWRGSVSLVYIPYSVGLQGIKSKLWSIFYSFRVGNEKSELVKNDQRQFLQIVIVAG